MTPNWLIVFRVKGAGYNLAAGGLVELLWLRCMTQVREKKELEP